MAPAAPGGLSPLAAKVLDQLSLTAWLPAALLIANTYLVAGMYLVRDKNTGPSVENLKQVVAALDDKAIGVILAVVLGIVLATLVTQSLEFAAIRFLEGYWGGSALLAIPTRLGVGTQQLRRRLMWHRLDRIDRKAFRIAQEQICAELGEEDPLTGAILAAGLGHPEGPDKDLARQARRYYHAKRWREYAPAYLRHRAAALDIKFESFPDDSRLMPTRLGNALRCAEDELHGDVRGAKMRGYLYQHLEKVGPALMEQHDQYRNRLDMCAVLTVLTVMLAVIDAVALPWVLPLAFVVGTCFGYLALSLLSYRGAVAAAMDYGPILVAMNKKIQENAPV